MEHESANNNAMKVIKRDGSLQDVHFDKITKRLQRIADRASLRVSPVKVAQKACASLYDNVTTAEIDALSSEIAASMSTEHPDYAVLAAHIAVSNLHRNTTTGVLETFGKMRGMMRDDVWAAIEARADDLDAMLDFSRDYGYDFFAMRTLERLYLTRVGGVVVERPQHMLLRVALGIWVDDLSRVKETYDTMSLKLATHATPTLFNAGLKNGQFSSCYLTGMDDSIEGIYKTLGECAQISKWAGGIGVHVHNIRSRNAPIRGTNGKSSGIIPMLRVFNNTARYVNQCFTPDTAIITEHGILPISKIEPGIDRVLTSDGKFRRVLKKITNYIEKDILEIKITHAFEPLRCTNEHEILVLKDQKKMTNYDVIRNRLEKSLCVPTFIPAVDITRDDMIGFPIPTHENPSWETPELWRFYGILLGDGHITSTRIEAGVCLNENTKSETIMFVESFLNERGVHFWGGKSQHNTYVIRWSTSSFPIITYDDVYDENKNKIISERFMHNSKIHTLQLVKGLLETDGSLGNELYFGTTSEPLAHAIRYLLLRLGILSSGHCRNDIGNTHEIRPGQMITTRKIYYVIRIPKHPCMKLIFPDIEISTTIKYIEHNGILWTRIKDIRKIPYIGNVHDLTVEDNHTYVVSNLGIVHNSGRRNGSFAMYIEPWHPDVFDFLDAKKNHGDEELRARDLFYAMWIPDLFMERVEAGAPWSLMDPDACPGLADAYGREFVDLYEGYEAEGRFVKQIDAQKLWFAILTAQIETGTPYLCYKDACNEKSNQKNLGTIRSSNLCSEIVEYSSPEETAVCLTGDAKILTRDGWARLDQITNWTDVFCPYEDDDSLRESPSFRKASLMPSGEKFVFEIAVSGSRPLRATANHLFLVRDDDGSLEWRRVDALNPGDELVVPEHDALPGGYAEPAEFDPVWFEAGEKRLDIQPSEPADVANYLRGIFAISGRISSSGYLHIGSSSLEFLYGVQEYLRCFGVHGIVAWPGGRGRLDIFGKTNLERFAARIGFVTNKQNAENPRREHLAAAIAAVADARSIRYAAVVEAVTEVGVLPVFDLTVPVARHFVANGVVTHNCNLASVALPMFVDADSKTYDYDALYRTTKIVARNLDRVIDKTYYPTEPARRSNFRHRPIGIGVQGLADVFQMLDVPFDSREALDLDRRIFETMYYAAIETSAELAGELGPYETYEGSPASRGLLQYDLWKEMPVFEKWDWSALKALIAKQGLRNSLSIALMPTASTSQVLGNTECIEPITSNVYARRTMAGEFVVVNRHLMRRLLNLGLWNTATRDAVVAAGGSVQGLEGLSDRDKAVFKTAWELRQKALIDLSANRGPFVCQSQSLNLFVTEPTFKKLSSMHFYAFRKGLKTGMYYLRTQSASKPVQVTLAAAKQKPSAPPVAADGEECLMCSA